MQQPEDVVPDYDFAIVADDIMLNGAFLLRQTLSEWYQCALWYPKDLEGYAEQLEDVPRVFFVGDSNYTRFFKAVVPRRWEDRGIFWGFKTRTCVILSEDVLADDPERQMNLDLALAHLRRDIRVERVQNRRSPGVRVAAKFLDPYTAMRTTPPSFMTPDDHVQLVQYQIAMAEFLRLGFDEWCWGKPPDARQMSKTPSKRRFT